MLFLTSREKNEWLALADEALAEKSGPEQLAANIRPNLMPMFDYYLGVFLAAKGQVELGRQWLAAGALTVLFIKAMRAAGKAGDISEVMLIDRSRGMLDMAEATVGRVINRSAIRAVNGKIEDVAAKIDRRYDIVISSLAYHHMPREQKRVHLKTLKRWMDNFIIFEIDANNDLPEQFSPELALSCVDAFLMTEEVSFLIQPRGLRNDYHMLKTQWHNLFEDTLAPEFACLCDSACYADEYTGLFTMHYGH